jgi:hypothetical protein
MNITETVTDKLKKNKNINILENTNLEFDAKRFASAYIHTFHSRFIPEGVAEVSQIFLRDTHVSPKLVSYEEHYRRDRW